MDKPIRVLHVVTHMNRGGLETMIMNNYRNIDRSKIQFDFLTHREGVKDYDDEILSLGGKIYHLPMLNPFDKNYLNQLDSFFKEHKEYKIVHSHLDCMSTYPLKYAKKNGVPVRIAHSHSTSQDKNLKYILKMYSRSQITKYATHLFSCGEEAGKWLFGNNEFYILNNAIDAKKYIYDKEISDRVRRDLGIENKFVIGHIGRFQSVKNHDFLVDVFKEVHDKLDNAVLLLVGDGELRPRIENKVKELGLTSSVIFTGVRKDVPELLQGMDVFVFPSLYEGLGIVTIEAQASGLRCIVSDTIPSEAFVTDFIESVSLNSTKKNWADNLLKYAKGYERINTYKQIKSKGYDIDEVVNKLTGFYLRMLGE